MSQVVAYKRLETMKNIIMPSAQKWSRSRSLMKGGRLQEATIMGL